MAELLGLDWLATTLAFFIIISSELTRKSCKANTRDLDKKKEPDIHTNYLVLNQGNPGLWIGIIRTRKLTPGHYPEPFYKSSFHKRWAPVVVKATNFNTIANSMFILIDLLFPLNLPLILQYKQMNSVKFFFGIIYTHRVNRRKLVFTWADRWCFSVHSACKNSLSDSVLRNLNFQILGIYSWEFAKMVYFPCDIQTMLIGTKICTYTKSRISLIFSYKPSYIPYYALQPLFRTFLIWY